MEIFKKYLWGIGLLCLPIISMGQNITRAEYFFDTDPGMGNGMQLSVSGSDTADFTATVATTGLNPGEHYLYLRTWDDRGVWSHHTRKRVWIYPSIDAAEYFFDSDPGVNNGISLPISAVQDSINFNETINTTGLTSGEHMVYIRTRDNNGNWSHHTRKKIWIMPSLVNAEYFFDTDPGVGNGTSISVTAALDSISFNDAINVTGVTPGEHWVYLRTQDDKGLWSHHTRKRIFVKPSIDEAEYFFDTDPGLGNGTPLTITPTLDSISFNESISTVGLGTGGHLLYIRTRDDRGVWSLHTRKRVYVESQLVAAEYFFDTDTGIGLCTPLVVGTPSDSVDWDISFIMPFVTPGNHHLYVRTMDDRGVWSHYAQPKVVTVLPVGEEDIENHEVWLYNSETSLFVKITGNSLNQVGDIALYDASGKLVFNKNKISLNQGINQIQVGNLPAATYFAELRIGEERIIRQLFFR